MERFQKIKAYKTESSSVATFKAVQPGHDIISFYLIGSRSFCFISSDLRASGGRGISKGSETESTNQPLTSSAARTHRQCYHRPSYRPIALYHPHPPGSGPNLLQSVNLSSERLFKDISREPSTAKSSNSSSSASAPSDGRLLSFAGAIFLVESGSGCLDMNTGRFYYYKNRKKWG